MSDTTLLCSVCHLRPSFVMGGDGAPYCSECYLDAEAFGLSSQAKDAAALLVQAAVLVEQATQKLDASQTPCNHCGRMSSNNLTEWRASRELLAAERKLREWSKSLAKEAGK